MIFLIMGVSCAGKTTIGNALASSLHAAFIDADTFHSRQSIIKMKNGIELSDLDRAPWLKKLNRELIRESLKNKNIVLACSALKEMYRSILLDNLNDYLIVYLRIEKSLAHKRQSARQNHFFNPNLLSSQFEILEHPMKNFVMLEASNSISKNLIEIFETVNKIKKL